MSRIPNGATVPEFYFEEASNQAGHAWRPIASSLDQRAALELMDACPTSFPRRVVQVVAVRLPDGQRAQLPSVADAIRKALAPMLVDGVPIACAMQDCEAPRAVGSTWCAAHLLGRPADPDYAGDRYAEDFPRPRGVHD